MARPVCVPHRVCRAAQARAPARPPLARPHRHPIPGATCVRIASMTCALYVDAELVGHGEQQRVGLGDRLVLLQLLDQHVRRGGIAAAEHGELFGFDIAEMILAVAAAEIGAVAIVDQREDAAADRHARLARMAGFFPGLAKDPDLLGLLHVEGFSAFVEFERRALQIHPQLRRPCRGGVGGGTPPDPLAQALRMRLEAQQAGRVGKHRPRVGLRRTPARAAPRAAPRPAAAPCRRRSGPRPAHSRSSATPRSPARASRG